MRSKENRKTSHIHGLEDNAVKMVPQIAPQIQCNPYQPPCCCLAEIDKLILKFI